MSKMKQWVGVSRIALLWACAPGRAMRSPARVVMLLLLTGLGTWGGNANAATRTSTATGGTWATGTTWVGGVAPLATDSAIIATTGANSVTLGANTAIVALTINPGSTLNLSTFRIRPTGATSISGTINLGTNIGTRFTGLVTINAGGTWTNGSNVAINFQGGLTNNGGTFTAGTGIYTFNTTAQAINGTSPIAIPNLTVATVAVTNNANLTVATALAGTTGSLVNGAAGVLNIGGTSAITTLTATTVGNTVNYTGAAQTVKAIAYSNLGLSGSGAKTLTGVTTVAGNLTMSGTATATTAANFSIGGNLNVGAGTTFTSANFTNSVTGTTTISGTLAHSGVAAKTYIGAVTVNAGGTWTNAGNAPIFFRGGLTHNGATFTAGTGIYTFNTTAAQSVNCATALAIPSVTVTAPTVLTNNCPNLTIATALAGTGTLTNAATGTLNIGGTSTVTTLTASAAGNTVNYSGAAQTVKLPSGAPATYYHLTLSGSGIKTLPATAMTIGGNFSVAGTASTTALAALTVGGNFSLAAGTAFTAGAFTHSVAGNFTNSGTFTAGTSTVTLNGTAAQAIGGTTTTTFNNLTIANTTAFVSAATSFNANGTLTVNASAVLSPAAAVVVGGTGTLTGAGTVQVTTTLAGGFAAQYTQTTKTLTNLTIDYAGAAAQTVTVQIYGSATGGGLKLSNASGVNLTADTTVAGTLNLANGVVNASTFTLIASGDCTTKVLRTSGHVAGKLQLYFPTGAPSCTFHVGDATLGTTYRPINVSFASVTTAGSLIGATSQGTGTTDDHANIATSGIDSAKDVNRYWTLAAGGVAYTTYDATFNFNVADYDVGANSLAFVAQGWNGTGWTPATIGVITATSIQTLGNNIPSTANAYLDFAAGEAKPANPGDFDSYDAATVCNWSGSGTIWGPCIIQTKIAGAPFSLDIVAINPAGTGVLTTFTGVVKVELLDSSNTTLPLDVHSCSSTWVPSTLALIPDQTFTAGDLGRHRINGIVDPNAWKNVRVRVTYPATGAATSIGCSTDNFAIRPDHYVVSVSDLDWQTAGTGRTLNNTGVSGGVVHKAGQPFTISATAYNAVGAITTNYSGSPLVGPLTCVAPATSCTPAMLTLGTWAPDPGPSASGKVTTTTASYAEAGSLNLTLEGRNFASVDNADTPATCAGWYICSSPIAVGRFVPDHLALAADTMITPQFKTFNDAVCAARSFTYAGQQFGFATAPQATITAQNASNGTTTNYGGTLWHLLVANATQSYATTSPQPLDTSLVGTSAMALAASGSGVGTLAPSPDNIAFTRGSTPYALFPAAISLSMNISDISEAGVAGNGNITATAPVVFNGTGTGIAWDSGNEIRFGRMKLGNALGSELLDLPIPTETQYWNGTQFITNDVDSCTTLNTANITLGNYLGLITSGNMSASHVSFTGPFAAGVGSLKLLKPGTTPAPGKGSVDVTVNLSAGGENKAYLQGGSTYNVNPTSRATFGVYKGNNNFIYLRENY